MKITMSRFSGIEDTPIAVWKDLISSLVLCGYEVYGTLDEITFVLGVDDKWEE
jgi:hypothetical protein